MIEVEKNVPEADCIDWLRRFIEINKSVSPKEAYKAGAKRGFTRNGIKAARRYFSELIETRINGDETLWLWRGKC